MFGTDRNTVGKILKHSVPPGYRRSKPPPRPKLDPFAPIIDQIPEDDRGRLKKQRQAFRRLSGSSEKHVDGPEERAILGLSERGSADATEV